MKGIYHIDTGTKLEKAEMEGEELHQIASGTSFPGTATEGDLFYRTDLHEWFQYNGSDWVSLTKKIVKQVIVLWDSSTPLSTGADKHPVPFEAWATLTIKEVRLKVKTAPTGAAIIVDVNKNGTTIFTEQANRPQIATGETEGNTITIDVTSLAKGDDITFDIDQVGSTTAGDSLVVEIIVEQELV